MVENRMDQSFQRLFEKYGYSKKTSSNNKNIFEQLNECDKQSKKVTKVLNETFIDDIKKSREIKKSKQAQKKYEKNEGVDTNAFHIPGFDEKIVTTPEENIKNSGDDQTQGYYVVDYFYNGKRVLQLVIDDSPEHNASLPNDWDDSLEKYMNLWYRVGVPSDERSSKPFNTVMRFVANTGESWFIPSNSRWDRPLHSTVKESLYGGQALTKEQLVKKMGGDPNEANDYELTASYESLEEGIGDTLGKVRDKALNLAGHEYYFTYDKYVGKDYDGKDQWQRNIIATAKSKEEALAKIKRLEREGKQNSIFSLHGNKPSIKITSQPQVVSYKDSADMFMRAQKRNQEVQNTVDAAESRKNYERSEFERKWNSPAEVYKRKMQAERDAAYAAQREADKEEARRRDRENSAIYNYSRDEYYYPKRYDWQ